MRQTTLSVALEVKPESYDHLSSLLDRLRNRRSTDPSGGEGPFADFLTRVPALHFMSLSVFPGFDYDPLFVIEANFDGARGPFWAQLESAIGPDLRLMLRCCKRPLDNDGPLFDSIVAANARAPIAPYLERRALTPTVYHHGNRGMTRDRILAEHALFEATRVELRCANVDGPNPYRVLSPSQIHAKLRAALLPGFGWLDHSAPKRIPLADNIADWARLIGFVIAAVFALSIPGLILSLIMPTDRYFILLAVAFLGFAAMLGKIGVALPGTGVATRFSFLKLFFQQLLPLVLFVLGYLVIAVAIGTPISMLFTARSFDAAWHGMITWLLWGLACVPVTVAGIVFWLRVLERGDASQDAPPVDPKMLREMARREDWIPQNHMGSIVLIKPGILRMILIRAGHLGLGLVLRIVARQGYLGSMRTIHFAHWAMVNNKSRLMFFSNFDQTWESYLDDFIEKAHAGLTLAWCCGVGFPPTRFLVKDGASHGRQFKEWARHSMSVSRFWYSAYKNLTAEQIERNFRIAIGLRKRTLSDKDAALWINDL
ncbi:hypothetical protein FHS95_003940 [Sphingomonas naasensis]|uniref:Uncharacterized protein n=1 Tax=Sphingomonas naasensis TaxID=1344951 RepID=A0A4S1WGF6_9SPHN|nr:hypothetical protein [Sphingomonas naasensis]NIJ22225.1 hypothetical protein [Sphingomonas naasensis]TGX40757.1 hypothetical protein E5A74_14835 [Sphingomonas naasensis]